MIIEYKNHRDGNRVQKPEWIENGGFLHNAGDFTLIGFSPSVHEYYIPDSVVIYTVEELKQRSLDIHDVTPYHNPDGSVMTDQEVEDMVQHVVDDNDIA